MMGDRHAYLILAHSNPDQLRVLLSLLDDPRNDIFVHVDARADGFDEADLASACHSSALRFVSPRIPVHWGGVSIMRAELALLKAATRESEYAYYHLLSGMDLPIKSQDCIHSFFSEHKGKEFLNFWKFKDSTHMRCNYISVFPEGASGFLTNLANIVFKYLQKAVGFKINKDVDFRYGSQWFSITDALARYVVSKEMWLEEVFGRTSTCDELFMPTLVWNSPFRDHVFDPTIYDLNTGCHANMRFIDWSRGESVRHPWTFLESDLPMLMGRQELWARKFNLCVDEKIIKLICDELQ